MNIRTVKLKTESRSVQVEYNGHLVSVGAMRQNDEPWPRPTVAVPQLMQYEQCWRNLSAVIDTLFAMYAKRFEGVINLVEESTDNECTHHSNPPIIPEVISTAEGTPDEPA